MATVSLLTLPSEVFVTIMSYLSTRDRLHVRMICRKFYSVTSDPIFWNTISWEYYNAVRDEKPLKTALRLGAPLLYCLKVQALDRFALSKFNNALKLCEKLKYVTLTGFRLSSESLKMLLTILPNLYHLEFDQSFKCTCTQFFKLAPLSKSLQSVIFNRMSSYIHVLRLWSEAEFSPPDVGVRYYYCSLEYSLAAVLDFTLHSLPKHSAKFSMYEELKSPYCILKLPYHVPLVELQFDPGLSIPYCQIFGGPEHVVCLGKHGENYMRAQYLNNIPSLSFPAPPISLPSTVKIISLFRCKDLDPLHLSLISTACPNLLQLNIQGCSKALSNLDGLSAIVSECKHLSGLNISTMHPSTRMTVSPCTHPDPQSIWKLLSQARNLSHLAIDMCLLCSSITLHSEAGYEMRPFLQGMGQRSRKAHNPSAQASESFEQYLEQMTALRALEVYDNFEKPISIDFMILSKFKCLCYLRIQMSSVYTVPKVHSINNLFLSLPNLKFFNYSSSVARDSVPLHLSDNPDCYKSLRHLYIKSRDLMLTESLTNAITHRRQLTHISLVCYCLSPQCLRDLVSNSPRLAECHLRVVLSVIRGTALKSFTASLKSELVKRGVKFSVSIRQRVLNSRDASDQCLKMSSIWSSCR